MLSDPVGAVGADGTSESVCSVAVRSVVSVGMDCVQKPPIGVHVAYDAQIQSGRINKCVAAVLLSLGGRDSSLQCDYCYHGYSKQLRS